MDTDTSPSPRHVLVVERDMIIGLGVAEDLSELGYRVSGPCVSFSEVTGVLATDSLDGAIIDVVLQDGSGIEAARLLRARGIPLVFFSAGDRRRFSEGEFKDVPWVDRPAPIERLLAALKLPRRSIKRPDGV
jgi:DNA-binding response OmpR family regulator